MPLVLVLTLHKQGATMAHLFFFPIKQREEIMTDIDAVKALEARVARLEAAHAQPSAVPHIPVYADPPAPPWWGGGWGGTGRPYIGP